MSTIFLWKAICPVRMTSRFGWLVTTITIIIFIIIITIQIITIANPSDVWIILCTSQFSFQNSISYRVKPSWIGVIEGKEGDKVALVFSSQKFCQNIVFPRFPRTDVDWHEIFFKVLEYTILVQSTPKGIQLRIGGLVFRAKRKKRSSLGQNESIFCWKGK